MKIKYFFFLLTFCLNFLVAQDVDCTEDNIGCMDENGCDYDPNALCPGECNWDCYGCNDETACNYNPNADVNLPQTLCVYTDLGCGCGLPASQPGYDCFGNCLVDEDEDGICDEIYGCTDPLAPNYQQEANIDNNSCENIVYGCTNPFAENFDELANTEDGSCELIGCMAEGALNYSESATIDSGDCVWLEPVIANTCNGRYLEKIYTEVEVETVTYSNEFGLVMDIYQGVGDTIVEDRPVIVWIHGGGWMGLPEFEGSFVYDSEQSQFVCNEMAQRGYLAVSVDYRLADPLQIFCNGLCDYFGDISPWSPWDQVDYVMDHAAKCFSDSKAAIRFLKKSFAEGNPYRLNPDNIYIGGHSAGGATVNHLLLEDEEDMTPDNYWTQYVNDNGGYYGESGNYGFSHDVAGGFNLSGAIPSLNSITEQDFDKLYISVHGEADNIVYYDYGPWPASIIPDAIFPFLTFAYPNMHGSGSIHNYMNSIGMENYHLAFQGDPFFTAGHSFNMWGPNGKYAMIDFVTTHIYNDLPCAIGDIGCTDPEACNYDSTAINDDGSCSEIIGCTDIMSCNFNPDAGCDDGSCTGSAGCIDENAFNYDSNATCQGYSSCIEIIEGCTYLYANNYNELANTDDGSCEIPGCTDELASNYNYLSTIDNGSCYYTPDCIQSSIEIVSECGSYTWFDEDIDTSGYYTPSFLNPISSDYEGYIVDMSNPTSLVVGKPTENGNNGLIKIYTRDGEIWTQKGNDILGQGLDISSSGDQFGIGVAMGDVNTIAASSMSSDYTYTVCGIPYWTLDCGIECFGFWPFITCIPYCFPQYNSNCNDETLYNKGIVNVYDWFEDEWVLKGESIWGTFEDDFSGGELDMPNSNTIAIGSSNTGLTSTGFTGNIRIYEFIDNNWIQKGNNLYGQIGGDEVGKGFSMGDKNTIAVCYSAQNLLKVFSWNGSEWVQMGQNIIVDEISQSVSMFNNSTLAVTGEIYTKVFEWNGIYWIPKGEPVLFTGGESVSMGGPNTFSVTRPESIALFRYQDGEWVLKTQTYNNPGPVVMGNPNILAIPGQVFEYVPEVNEDGCEEITILELIIDDPAISGCTNPLACNYDETAVCDDGSCSEISGCTDPTACNYNPNAGCDDGSCSEISGCTDPNACNYNSDAGCDDNSCYNNDLGCGCDQPAAEPGYDCFGNCLIDTDGDGICDEFEILGCLDINACNYDSNPTTDEDNSLCNYLDGICDTCLNGIIIDNDADNDGVCDDDEVLGCTDDSACNYNELATENDNSCYNNDLGCGCDQPAAEPGYDCFGNCLIDTDGDGICDEFEILGCLDINACNYDSNPTTDEDNSLCNYLDGICDTCLNGIIIDNDADNDGVCDDDEVLGCTDDSACNYNELATENDNSCVYLDPYLGSIDNIDFTIENCDLFSDQVSNPEDWPYAFVATGPWQPNSNLAQNFVINITSLPPGGANYRVVKTVANGNWDVGPTTPLNLGFNYMNVEEVDYDRIVRFTFSSGEIGFDSIFLNDIEQNCNIYLYDCDNNCFNDLDVDGICDELEITGCTDSTACNYDNTATDDDGSCLVGYESFTLILYDTFGDGWWSSNNSTHLITINNINYGSDFTNGSLNPYDDGLYISYDICLNPNICNTFEFQDNGSYEFECSWELYDENSTLVLSSGPSIFTNQYLGDLCFGCTSPIACNYDSNALVNDINDPCIFPSFGYDCNNNCINDSDGDGVCNVFEIVGCQDQTACNYNPEATDQGPCTYTDGICEDCIGGIIIDNDLDDDGVCNNDEILGCQDLNACNYNPDATDEATCIYLDGICDSCFNGIIIDNDADNDGVCDNDEVAGCQDLSACNYNPVATDDDNSCFYPAEQYLDCYGNCINDSDGDGICNELEILGCTDANACNYDFNSTENDGSCTYSVVGLDCFGNCINDLDNDGVCDENEILGCTNPSAVNFNNLATEDNNSCDFGPFGEINETDCIMTIVFSEDFSLSYGNQVFSEGWIGVTDADGNVYGSTFWSEGQNNSIMAYGSNINNEGIAYNEELNWIFSFNNNNIIMSPVYGFADGIFSCSDLAIIESLSSDLPGCLDSEAFNFNNLANIDDNSCDYGPWDEIPNTDCNMTILIPGDANISIDGEQILDAWIGLTDSDGNICGSTYWTYGETGAIAAWGEDDGTFGFEVGETINWIISTPEGDLFGNVSLSFGSNEYACNALAGINSIDFGLQNYTQEIELYTGWNMWSTYIEPQNNNIENLFSGVSNNLLIVKDENGSVYWPLFGLNTIGDLTKGKGYQTKMSNDDVLIVEGSLIPSNYSFNIPIGWSIIGYLHTTCYNASDMMSPLANQIIILKDESGLVFWPTFGLNTIGDMCPDKGYQIKMLEESVFNYPSYSRFGYSNIDIIDKTVYYDEAKNTGNNMIIGLPIESWNTLPKIGDEIAAYDNVGNLVGSTMFNGDHIALTVWGNDATTNVKDGLYENEELVFRVWSSEQNEEYSMRITNWQSGSNIYITDNINIASNIVIDTVNKNDLSILFQNSPNPFSESTKIEFFVPKKCLVNLTLHNIMGEKIKTISNSEFESGNHEIIFRSDDLSPGTYFINMQTKDYNKTLKINLTK